MFDNRLVFESPGRLPGLVRAENIRHTHFSRNPKIAQFLKAYSFVKEFGEGIDRICNELESRGSTIPSFYTDAFILKATLMAEFVEENTDIEQKNGGAIGGTIDELKLTERQSIIYNEIKLNPSHTAKSLAERTGLSVRTIEREVPFLRKNGFIDKKDKSNNSEWIILK